MSTNMTDNQQRLLDAAKSTRERSYSPYSGFKVGAAILMSSGKIYSGCNIENASYGATNCAERVAVQTAVAANDREIREVLVLTDQPSGGWPPCGLCRQVIAEFAAPGLVVHIANLDGKFVTLRWEEIFPHAFTPDHLKRV